MSEPRLGKGVIQSTPIAGVEGYELSLVGTGCGLVWAIRRADGSLASLHTMAPAPRELWGGIAEALRMEALADARTRR